MDGHDIITPIPVSRNDPREQRKRWLIRAMQTRVVTDAEMQEATDHGPELFLEFNDGMSQSYSDDEIQKQFNELFLQQYRIRAGHTSTQVSREPAK